MKPEFDRRNVRIIGLSVDPVDSHSKRTNDIEQTQDAAVIYPTIGEDFIIADSVTGDMAKNRYPAGWKAPNPCHSYRSTAEGLSGPSWP